MDYTGAFSFLASLQQLQRDNIWEKRDKNLGTEPGKLSLLGDWLGGGGGGEGVEAGPSETPPAP